VPDLPDYPTAEQAASGGDPNLVKGSPRKPTYPIRPALASYLTRFRRELALPVSYQRLQAFHESVPLLDAAGRDTCGRR
jgi:hypothetical protein